jgi:hypothetical protein
MVFPTDPEINQVFNPGLDSGVSYVWNGYAWKAYKDLNVASGNRYFYQEDIPAEPLSNGDMWFNVNDGILYIYTDDSENMYWVQVT